MCSFMVVESYARALRDDYVSGAFRTTHIEMKLHV
jgi:hypothetical protein